MQKFGNDSDFRNPLPRFPPVAPTAGAEAVDRSIPGTTKLNRLEESRAAAAVERTADFREGDSAACKIPVHGARYPEQLERMTGR